MPPSSSCSCVLFIIVFLVPSSGLDSQSVFVGRKVEKYERIGKKMGDYTRKEVKKVKGQ